MINTIELHDNLLASGSSDRSIRIYDIKSNNQIHKLNGHKGHVTTLKYYPSGRYILSGATDNTVRIWDLDLGLLMHLFDHDTDPSIKNLIGNVKNGTRNGVNSVNAIDLMYIDSDKGDKD